jgi:hypothetical protein
MTQLSKIIKAVLLEQLSSTNQQIAKQIYDAKGVVVDNEKAAVAAILKIKDANQFNLVQKELQKLTGGRGIGQYVSSFIGHLEDVDTAGLGVHATGRMEGERTGPLLDKIIRHLTSINAGQSTIKIFSKLKAKLNQQLLGNIWNTEETMHTVNTVGSIVSLVAGPLGLALSAAFSLNDVKQYYDEGKNYEAGLSLVLSLVPGVGAIAKPVIKKLVSKIVTKSGILTKAEKLILNAAVKNKTAIKNKIADLTAAGIKSGKINPSAIKTVKWIKPLADGSLKFLYGTGTGVILPAAIYTSAYAGNEKLITDAEMAALDRKYTALAGAYLDKRIAQETSKIKESTQISDKSMLTEIGLGDVLTLGNLVNSVIGIGTYALTYVGIYKAAVTAYPKLRKLTAFRTVAKDKRFLRSQGMTNAEINALWKSNVFYRADQSLIDGGIESLKAGAKTPTDVLKLYNDIIPGKGTEKWLQLNSLYNTAKKPTSRWRSTSSTKKPAAIVQGWSAEKFPNITADQYANLNLNQRVRLNAEPTESWSNLRNY